MASKKEIEKILNIYPKVLGYNIVERDRKGYRNRRVAELYPNLVANDVHEIVQKFREIDRKYNSIFLQNRGKKR